MPTCVNTNVFVNFSKDRPHHEKKFQLSNCFKFIKDDCMKNVLCYGASSWQVANSVPVLGDSGGVVNSLDIA